ncbi:MAG: hypothetical protein WC956_09870 [bacterium]
MKRIGMALMIISAVLGLIIYSKPAFSASIFSTDPSDYSAVIKINSDGTSFQVVKYGRLAKGVLYKDLKSVADMNMKIPNFETQVPPQPQPYHGPFDEELKYQKILTSVKLNTCTQPQFCYIVIPALCDILPNKDNDTKGQLFRCIMEIERDADGKTQKELITKYSSEATENFFHIPENFFVNISISLPFNKLIAAGAQDSDNDEVPDSVDNCDKPNFSQEVDSDGNPVACPAAAVTAADCASLADQICTADAGYTKTADCAALADTICPSAGYTLESAAATTNTTPATTESAGGGKGCTLIPTAGVDVSALFMLAAALAPLAWRRRR